MHVCVCFSLLSVLLLILLLLDLQYDAPHANLVSLLKGFFLSKASFFLPLCFLGGQALGLCEAPTDNLFWNRYYRRWIEFLMVFILWSFFSDTQTIAGTFEVNGGLNGLKESTYVHVAGPLRLYSTRVVTRKAAFKETISKPEDGIFWWKNQL